MPAQAGVQIIIQPGIAGVIGPGDIMQALQGIHLPIPTLPRLPAHIPEHLPELI